MKTLLLMRHAKSDWDAGAGSDHERPLNARGRKAAGRMGHYLSDSDQVPDYALTSTAVRARTTLQLAKEAGSWATTVREERALYLPASKTVLRIIRGAPDEAGRLLLVGHQPTWSEVTSLLIGGGRLRFPTAAIARVDFDIDHWREVAFGEGTLVHYVVPKLLA